MSAQPALTLQSYQPATYRDRGLAVPFTSPALAGARIRAARRDGAESAPERRVVVPSLELLVPNPSGGRGTYVLPWANRRAMCCVTVHDTQLGAALELRLQMMGGLTPPLVRRAARETALAGFAGRSAAAAAAAALDRTERRIAATRRRLLVGLIQQTEGKRAAPPELDTPDILDWRAMGCLERLASGTLVPPETLFRAMAELAVPISEFDASGGGDAASPEDVFSRLVALQDALQAGGDWAQSEPGRARAPAAVLAAAAEVTVRIARLVVQAAQRRLTDIPRLLAAWSRTPDAVLDELLRPAWVLDGWDRICAMWQEAEGRGGRTRVLAELAALVPLLPDEADQWIEAPAGTLVRTNSGLNRQPMPFAAAAFLPDRVARNEALRAAAA